MDIVELLLNSSDWTLSGLYFRVEKAFKSGFNLFFGQCVKQNQPGTCFIREGM